LHKTSISPLALSAAFLLGLTTPEKTYAEWDDWIIDASVGVERVENISHALSGTPYDEDKNDTLVNPQIVYGRIFQAADNTRLIFTAKLDGKAYQYPGWMAGLPTNISCAMARMAISCLQVILELHIHRQWARMYSIL
jgi:hypothetical protein